MLLVEARGWRMIASTAVYMLVSTCVAQAPEPAVKASACTCATIKQTDGWCERCKTGYLAGVKIESASFFEALDAHGHDIDPTLLRCEQCKKHFAAHGYCDQCKAGFVRKQAYFSKLTYYLARGEVKDARSIHCPVCRKNNEKPGWCDVCRVGMVGFHAYGDKQEFKHAARVWEILISAIDLAKECLSCALAMINDGTCLQCKASFKDGRKAPAGLP